MKINKLFSILLGIFLFPNVYSQTMGIVGQFTGWGTNPDVVMTSTDNIQWNANNVVISENGGIKFRLDNDWGTNWGGTTFPSGIAEVSGTNIPSLAGIYDVSFNTNTLEYTFSAVATNFQEIFIVSESNEFQLTTFDGINYRFTDKILTTVGVKFKVNTGTETIFYGGSSFPLGIANENINQISNSTGYYNITFNAVTKEYSFEVVPISVIGDALVDWTTDTPMNTDDNGITYKITTNLFVGNLKFRANNSWATNWGAQDANLMSGTAVLNSANNIFVNLDGHYDIVFNRFSLAYCIVVHGNPCDVIDGFLTDNDSDGYASDVDCDDNDQSIYPGAPELCDGKDNDCNGETDDNVVLITYYFDNDLDGFGDSNNSIEDCQQPGGYVLNNLDCDDFDETIYPDAPELCDDKDNDCDGQFDENLNTVVYYMDFDGDGYGGGSAGDFCSDPGIDYTLISGDCDDENNEVYPGAIEIPNNGIDENCDGLDVMNEFVEITYQVDVTNYILQGNAIQANGMRIAGNFAELNALSNGQIMSNWSPLDENSAMTDLGSNIWSITVTYPTSAAGQIQSYKYVNGNWGMNEGGIESTILINACGDDDGFGNVNRTYSIPTFSTSNLNCYNACGACILLEDNDMDGYYNDVDCDDFDETIYPSAPELCDDKDNDCDGETDENLNTIVYYMDNDGDGYGGGSAGDFCSDPGVGYTLISGDCNDDDNLIFPGANDIPDNDIDEDCNGSDASTTLVDNDGDGYNSDVDCNDNDNTVYPGAPELCDLKDNDCNDLVDDNAPTTIYYVDNDNDGFGSGFAGDYCTNPGSGFALNNNDCNDDNANIKPGATEVCDQLDNNCNGFVDEGLPTSNFYVDSDGDGYGAGLPQPFCNNPGVGYSNLSGDCNNNNPNINPNATEIPDNGIDEDCVGGDQVSNLSEYGQSRFIIVPNPGNDFIKISFESTLDYIDVVFYNNLGQKIKLNSIKSTDGFEINTNNLKSGVYFVEISSSNWKTKEKWIKF